MPKFGEPRGATDSSRDVLVVLFIHQRQPDDSSKLLAREKAYLRFHKLSMFTRVDTQASSATLATVLETLTSDDRHPCIHMSKGTWNVGDWGRVLFTFGDTLAYTRRRGVTRLREIIQDLKKGKGMIFCVSHVVRLLLRGRMARHTAIQVLRDPSTIPDLYTLKSDELIPVYGAAKRLPAPGGL